MWGRMLVGIALALGLALPAVAHATASLELRYAPPVIEFSDDTKVKTIEDLRLRILGANFIFQNPPAHSRRRRADARSTSRSRATAVPTGRARTSSRAAD